MGRLVARNTTLNTVVAAPKKLLTSVGKTLTGKNGK